MHGLGSLRNLLLLLYCVILDIHQVLLQSSECAICDFVFIQPGFVPILSIFLHQQIPVFEITREGEDVVINRTQERDHLACQVMVLVLKVFDSPFH